MIKSPFAVLLVEDNPAHAELVIRTLKGCPFDHEVHHVADGQEALDYLFRDGNSASREDYRRPDLVLLDLRLPKVDGLEVLDKVKRDDTLSTIPVVVLTTSDAANDMEAAYRSNVNSYLTKPSSFAEFSELMEDLSKYWLKWNCGLPNS